MSRPNWQYGGSVGEAYQKFLVPAFFAQWAEELIALAAPQPGERVLDIACGTGVVTRLAAQAVGTSGSVAGLDISAAMLDVAKMQPSTGAAIEWKEGSALDIPLPDAGVDLVLCHHGIQFFPNKPLAVREMRRVLRPGGRVAIAAWQPVEYIPGFAAVADTIGRYVNPEAGHTIARVGAFSLGGPDVLRSLLNDGGFRDVEVRTMSKPSDFPSARDFVLQLEQATPPVASALAQANEAIRAAILSDVEATLAEYMTADGLRCPMGSNLAIGTK